MRRNVNVVRRITERIFLSFIVVVAVENSWKDKIEHKIEQEMKEKFRSSEFLLRGEKFRHLFMIFLPS